MKLKLFLISILVLLSFVGYKTYTDTKALKSIDSYESCIASKGSVIQESYPATCITRLGSRFIQPIVTPLFSAALDWKIYSFDKAGFSFLAPGDWLVYPQDTKNAKLTIGSSIIMGPSTILKNISPDDGPKIGGFKVGIKGYIGGNGFLDERTYLDNNLESQGELIVNNIKYTKKIIDNKVLVLARRIMDPGFGVGIVSEIYIPLTNDYGLILMVETKDVDPVFDQVLSSFQFTN